MPTPIRKSTTPDHRSERPFSMRAFAGQPTSVDVATRSFDAVVTTETPVTQWIEDPRVVPLPGKCPPIIAVGEILLTDGIDLSRARGMPFVDCHQTYGGINAILGKVTDIRAEGQSIVSRITLATRHSDLIGDIAEGFYSQISAGYYYDLADAEFVEQPDGAMPILLVKKWVLTEVSNVAVAADPNAFIRSFQNSAVPGAIRLRTAAPQDQETTMDIEEVVAAAEAAVTAAEEAISAAEDAVPEELVERIKALRAVRADETTDAEKIDDSGSADDAAAADAEKKDAEAVRSIAKTYGLTKLIDDMRSLGAKPAELKEALKRSIAQRGTASEKEVAVEPSKRSAPVVEKTDFQRARSAYDKLNGKK
ncbi:MULTISPECIES: hypothetical protein [Rhizobium]|uniref:hypothetical protein n=1 Tax=Rhizobium TaxID=379 RepID=UPI0004021AA4|nr:MULTISPECIES: hypothetical protein [Rhizobium]UFS81555.1 hypothetical protein LPB79_25115 [Rhizobium sp. T136]